MLQVRDIHTYIGESHILQGVSLEVPKGKLVALLGRNGMGKTTLISSIIGFRPIRTGSILLEGREISALPAHRVVRCGISLVPQGRRIFSSLTVRENLDVPYKCPSKSGKNFDIDAVLALFPNLRARKDHRGGKLSGGEQQMLATGRALVCGPRLLLMDEPSEGLAPMLVRRLGENIRSFKEQGLTILLVEQKLSLALSVADEVYIMSKGKIVYSGKPEDLAGNEEVKRRHLGI